MATINRFEDLEIWKDARILCKEIKALIFNNAAFSKDYSLNDQILRSSGSIMDNIAEQTLNPLFEQIEKLKAGIKNLMNYLKNSDIRGNKFKKP